MDYAVKVRVVQNNSNSYEYYQSKHRYHAADLDDPEYIRRWKTEKGALDFIKNNKKWNPKAEMRVVQIETLPEKINKKPKKFTKEEAFEFRKKLVQSLLKHGWVPNTEYTYNNKAIQQDFTGYMIDAEKHYAISLKSQVLTVHDGTRQFCKVLSMEYNEMEITNKELVCGKIALRF